MKKCPYCGSDYGYFIKYIVEQEFYYTFADEADGSNDGEEIIKYFANRKKMFCRECGKYIGMKVAVE